MNGKASIAIVLLVIVGFVAVNSLYIIDERQSAIKLRFSEVVKTDIEPGLHFKIPLIEEVKKFDARIITLDSQSERFITNEQKSLEVDAYVQWRIYDTSTFYTANSGGDYFRANQVLGTRVNSALRDAFGARSLRQVVTGLNDDVALPTTGIIDSDAGERDALMDQVLRQINGFAQTELGLEVLDIRVKAIDLPQQVSADVFRRMRSDRDQEARRFRSEGQRQAEIIRANADQQRTVVLAEAFRDSEELRGLGDAEAASIYAEAFQQDEEFYAFYRSLNAYRGAFSNGGDIMVLDPTSEFFRFLNNPAGSN